jgi:hypothetical protein
MLGKLSFTWAVFTSDHAPAHDNFPSLSISWSIHWTDRAFLLLVWRWQVSPQGLAIIAAHTNKEKEVSPQAQWIGGRVEPTLSLIHRSFINRLILNLFFYKRRLMERC